MLAESLLSLSYCMCWLAGTEAFDADRAVSKGELKGRAMGTELDVKPSAPTSVPLRVRFGDGGTPSSASVPNQAFPQGATAR